MMLIALGCKAIASYPEGGPLAVGFIQYPLGLRALGHRVFWIEVIQAALARAKPELVKGFFELMAGYGLAGDCALIAAEDLDNQALETAEVYGKSAAEVAALIDASDVLWNFATSIRQPLLGRFRQRALIDGDPGHLQVCALTYNFDIQHHQVLLSVGNKIADEDCEAPRLGREWKAYRPYVFIPMWPETPDPGPQAPFSSITQWSWEELEMDGRRLSLAKRESYLRNVTLPMLTRRPFELAANIGANDVAEDRKLFGRNGWRIVEPYAVAGTRAKYQAYLRSSRAEILCCKPIFRELKTGWISDRSLGYLASGRPVLAEDCGFKQHLPASRGMLSFESVEEAAAQVAEIDGNYNAHSRAARELAEGYFGSRECLDGILRASLEED
ncbi:MAG: hypothetical protein ABSG46_03130 [Candidatus Binataceae bacterium]